MHENENVFSHNDLNAKNILMSKNNIFFIDFEYSSINNKYFDISKIIDSLNLNNPRFVNTKNCCFHGCCGSSGINYSTNPNLKI